MTHFDTLTLHINETAASFLSYGWAKVPVCFIMGGFAFLFGLENGSILVMLVTLMAFDLMTGIASAYVAKEEITSRRALKTASKLAVYSILFSASYIVETLIPGRTFIDEAMISFLALTELISIMENAGKMGFVVPQKLLNRLQQMRADK